MPFKLVSKNGSLNYVRDPKTGAYGDVFEDSISEHDNLSEAVAEFLYSVEDYGKPGANKVTLTYNPSKKDKKKGKK